MTGRGRICGPVGRKPLVLFVSFTNLREGGGAEHALLNIVRFAPYELVDVIVLQASRLDHERLERAEVEAATSKARVLTVNRLADSLSLFERNPWIWGVVRFFLRPVAMTIERKWTIRPIMQAIGEVSSIYLAQNDDISYFRDHRYAVYGSDLCWGWTQTTGYAKKLELKLIAAGLLWNRIDGFHLYPHHRNGLNTLRRPLSFTAPLGVDTTLFFPAPRRDDSVMRFLFVSRLEECKGVLTVIDAWQEAHCDGQAELHVAGTGSLERVVRQRLPEGAIFHGALSDMALAKLYRECDVFLFPTRCDSYGLVVLEAASSGLYIVASDNLRGIFDDLQSFGCLEYMSPDSHAIAMRIRHLLQNRELRDRNRANIHNHIAENYDWRVVTAL